MTTVNAAAPGATRHVGAVAGGRAAIGYGGIAMAIGAYQAVREDSLSVQIPTDVRVMLAVFALSMLVLVPAQLGLAGFAHSRLGAVIASVGTPLLAVGATSSALNGEDFDWFPIIAVVANALWLLGTIVLAVSLWQAGRVPRWIAVTLPFTMPVTLLLSQIGGGLLAGAFWVTVGLLMTSGRMVRG